MARAFPHWDEETLFTSGDEYFAGLLRAIDDAKLSVELETYIFEKGTLADRLVEKLIAAHRRGVRVRITVDGWGSPGFLDDYYPQFKQARIGVRFFRVTPWLLRRVPGDSSSFLFRFITRWRRINRGNHRKFCLIDHQELYVGSFNVSDVHLREISGDHVWKDVGVRVKGRDVKYARRAFQRAYRGWTALNGPARAPKLLLLNDSFRHSRRTRLQHTQRMRHARKRIWLSTPYFASIAPVFRTLVRQAQKGVDVRLIVPHNNDVWFMTWMSLPLLRALDRKGVKVYVYGPRFSHQKVFIADDWVCVGSTNLNHRSFLHDLEMDVVLTRPGNKERVIDSYRRDIEVSQTFDSSDWAQLPWWKQWFGSLFLLVKYWA